MPYYCTVPQCTSMAGKAKNVSFHQFPRDEELAKLWNKILKRGKPYTKYSKVCSLHFTPDDYTMTSGHKCKGQWRTLRKDAVPSQNLPTDSPATCQSNCATSSNMTATVIDPRIHQQMAQHIYVQTMLAMQAASLTALNNESPPPTDETQQTPEHTNAQTDTHKSHTSKCAQCSKCFKDPDVFLLHKRTHKDYDNNDMLKANPILANLLNDKQSDGQKTTTNIDSQILKALTVNMENYLTNLSTIMTRNNDGYNLTNDRFNSKDDDVDSKGDDLDSRDDNFDSKGDDLDSRDDNFDSKGDGVNSKDDSLGMKSDNFKSKDCDNDSYDSTLVIDEDT